MDEGLLSVDCPGQSSAICLVNNLPPSRLFPDGPHERQLWRLGSHVDNPEDSNYLLLLKPV